MSPHYDPHFCLTAKHDGSTIQKAAAEIVPIVNKANDLLTPHEQNWLSNTGFRGFPGETIEKRAQNGKLETVFASVDAADTRWALAHLPGKLRPGYFRVRDKALTPEQSAKMAIGWALDCYGYKFRKNQDSSQRTVLIVDPNADAQAITSEVSAVYFGRDLINMPSNIKTPKWLTETIASNINLFHNDAASSLIITHKTNDVKRDYPLVYAVGKGAGNSAELKPRVLKFQWGDAANPRVGIVGKGITYDTGGHNLKPAGGMRDMKRDMTGAAYALALAKMIMSNNVPVFLNVSIPIAFNAISEHAMKPGDVFTARNGKTVEIENTDAEGRMILADAMAEITEQPVDTLITLAGLTGIAPVAVGPQRLALFGSDEEVNLDIRRHGQKMDDPVWDMPMAPEIKREINSDVADMMNSGAGMSSHMQAAFFLKEFTGAAKNWIHGDGRGWNMGSFPGRPRGGEARRGTVALASWLQATYG